jgi:hypothetical protein
MPLPGLRSGPSYDAIEQTDGIMDNEDERDQLLEDDSSSDTSTPLDGGLQEGVQKIEAISVTWTTRSLIVAYVRWVLLIILEEEKEE